MPLIDIKEDLSVLGSKFRPKADQKRFISTFAVRHGNPKAGFKTERELQEGLECPHIGKTLAGFETFSESNGKSKKENIVNYMGMELVEMIAPREDWEQKQKLEGNLSKRKIDAKLAEGKQRAMKAGLPEQYAQAEVEIQNLKSEEEIT